MLAPEQLENVKLYVAANDEDQVSLQVNQLNAELESPVEIKNLEYSTFETLCRQLDRRVLNLLQGDYKVAEEGEQFKQLAVRCHTRCQCLYSAFVLSTWRSGVSRYPGPVTGKRCA